MKPIARISNSENGMVYFRGGYPVVFVPEGEGMIPLIRRSWKYG